MHICVSFCFFMTTYCWLLVLHDEVTTHNIVSTWKYWLWNVFFYKADNSFSRFTRENQQKILKIWNVFFRASFRLTMRSLLNCGCGKLLNFFFPMKEKISSSKLRKITHYRDRFANSKTFLCALTIFGGSFIRIPSSTFNLFQRVRDT